MEREKKFLRPYGFSAFILLMALFVYSGPAVPSAQGSMIIDMTSPGTTVSDGPVSAKATFTTTTDKINIVLENLIVDQKSVGQNISGIYFTVSTGQTAGTLTSSSGLLRSVASDGSYTNQGTALTGWQLSTSDSQLRLKVLKTPVGPAHTILGLPNSSGKYKEANRSITENKSHNPFIAGPAEFELYVPGVTSASVIGNVTFLFGTSGEPVHAPEPATLAFLGLGGLGFLRPRKKL